MLRDFSRLGTFDIVICRNVPIHFAKAAIARRPHRQLASDGVLILRAKETVIGICNELTRDAHCRSAVYTSARVPAFA
ncbi:hypothetical protein GC176_15385 [bacterium]|nr:hypothetical protein [bacterium]